MDIVFILLSIAGVLLFYQLVIYQDPDKLDAKGRPIRRKSRERIF